MVNSVIKKKVVIVGDGDSGKTCLLMVFKDSSFPKQYIPTVFDNHVAEFELDNIAIELQLRDTAGQEDYDRLRVLSYSNVDVVLVCFSIAQPSSFENVTEKWMKEVRHFCPNVPIVLVGNKKDLRIDDNTSKMLNNHNLKPVEHSEGSAVAGRFKARAFVECSALTGENVREVFYTATRVAIAHSRRVRRKNQCTLL